MFALHGAPSLVKTGQQFDALLRSGCESASEGALRTLDNYLIVRYGRLLNEKPDLSAP